MNAPPPTLALRALHGNAWFGSLPTALQDVVVARSTIRTWRRGETIQREGEPARDLCVVLSGRVRCMIRCGTDRETVAHVGGPGFWFGWVVMYPRLAAVMTVVADAPSQVMHLSSAEFERIVEADPRSFRPFASLAFELAGRLMRYLGELPGLSLDGVLRVRLADLATRTRLEAPSDGPVELGLSQADLASMVGMSRQRLNQRLRALQDEGLVRLGFRRIVVPDPKRLRASAGVEVPAAAFAEREHERVVPRRRLADR